MLPQAAATASHPSPSSSSAPQHQPQPQPKKEHQAAQAQAQAQQQQQQGEAEAAPLPPRQLTVTPGASPVQQRLELELIGKGFSAFRFVRVPADYYDQPLEYRQACLQVR